MKHHDSMTSLDRAEPDEIESVRAEATLTFRSTATRVRHLTNRAAALTSQLTHQRDQLNQFVAQFALEQRLRELGANDHAPPTGDALVFDRAALRHDGPRLDEAIARATILRDQLDSARARIQESHHAIATVESASPANGDADLLVRQAMNVAREEERRRLAREIHDGPAQILGNTILAIQTAVRVAKRRPDHVAEELENVVTLLRDGVEEIRRFMFDLQPTTLQDQGLVPTIQRHVDDYCRFFGMRVSFTHDKDLPALSAAEQLAIFRIVQEALQNVQKYARTDVAAVELIVRGDDLCLTIADAGRGFHPSKPGPVAGGGAGVPGMRERATLIGADLTVVSAPDVGTSVTIVLPFRMPRVEKGTAES
jgi:two-component system sensor histidine kinase DegS